MPFFLTLIVVISIYIIGYITLNAFLWKYHLDFYEKILLSPPLFFVMPLIAYIVNLFFDGRILSSNFYFYFFLIIFFTILCFFSYPKLKDDLFYLKDELGKLSKNLNIKNITFIISLIILISFTVFLSIRPLIISPMLGGDFFRHIMSSRQLLNGFLYSHWCYDIASNEQPFLMHSAIATVTRFFKLHIFDTVFVLIFFQAILLPVGVAVLTYKIKKKIWISLLLTFFICVNGGREFVWVESWVLNIAQHQTVPGVITGQISIALFPFFIYSIIKIFENRDNIFFRIYSSIILSILGTIHAHVFYFSIVFLAIMIILNFKNKKLIKTFLMISIIGISVSLIYYLPLIYNLLIRDLSIWQKSDERWTVILNIKRFLNHFGVIGVISIPSLFLISKIKYRKVFISVFISLVIIYSFTFIADIITGENDPIMPFRQQRFSYILCIFLSIMVVLFINFFREAQRKYMLILCIFLIFSNIAFSIKPLLVNSDIWCEVSTTEGVKYNLLFRDKENVVDKLLRIANKKDIISVPSEISKIFVYYSGLDVVFGPWAHVLLEENIPELQLERSKDIETIYNPGTDKLIIKELFKKYRVKYFLVFKEDRKKFDLINFLEIIDEGKWLDNKNILIYKVLI